jgi:hypothetical protein
MQQKWLVASMHQSWLIGVAAVDMERIQVVGHMQAGACGMVATCFMQCTVSYTCAGMPACGRLSQQLMCRDGWTGAGGRGDCCVWSELTQGSHVACHHLRAHLERLLEVVPAAGKSRF